MRLAAAVVLATTAAALVTGDARAANMYVLRARLASTSATIDATRAVGSLTGKLTLDGKKSTFTWTLTFNHLSGRPTHAGIYFGTTGSAPELAMLLCSKCASGAHSFYRGAYVASPAFVRTIVRGGAYAIVATRLNPKGEIRGRIKTTNT